MRIAWSAAISSASTVLCETAVCFFDCALSGKNVLAPYKARKTPEVLLCPDLSPAKSASENRPNETSSGPSPTKPICRHCVVPLMYLIKRKSLRSQRVSHFVIMVESTPTALKRSGRANRAIYIIFIKTLQAILLNAPVQATTVSDSSEDSFALPLGAPASAEGLPFALGVGGAPSKMAAGSLASSRNGVGAVPTLFLAFPESSQNALTQSCANRSRL